MKNPEEIKQIVINHIANQTQLTEQTISKDLNQNLNNDLGLDSLDTVEIAMHVEGELEIGIPDEKMEDIKTVQNFIDIVTSIYQSGFKSESIN